MEYALRKNTMMGIKNWWALTILGILFMLIGIACFIWPIGTVATIIYVFGFFALVSGIFNLVGMFSAGDHWWVFLLKAIVGIAVGLLALFAPGALAFTAYWLIAIWAIISGIAELIGAIAYGGKLGGGSAFLEAIGGIISIIFGVLLWTNVLAGAIAIVIILGIYGLIYGIFLIAFSLQARSVAKVAH
jgi:uncharacterized membrane protein HdeD (DUF308 family)